jgi:hypothetical protein
MPDNARRRILTPWDAGAPPLSAVPAGPPAERRPSTARYKDRPEKRAAIEANIAARKRLAEMAHAPSIYAERVARARDSHQVGLMLWQLEGAMRSLDRSGWWDR